MPAIATKPKPAQQQQGTAPALIDAASFSFGPQQDVGILCVSQWLKNDTKNKPVFWLFGHAGTGKTTIARYLASEIDGEVCFAAFTGKASLMLRRAGCKSACTIHKALYLAKRNRDGSYTLKINPTGPAARAKLIVIDECSMVDEVIGQDLMSLGIPILVLGDPAQLPPVKSAGFFTDISKPDVMLTEIHRQARDNPIIRLATAVRERRSLPYGTFGTVEIGRPGDRAIEDVVAADQIIVGRNATREAFNTRIRKHLGRSNSYPEAGDRLVCLRNDQDMGIFNGGLFDVQRTVNASSDDIIPLILRSEDEDEPKNITANVLPECFEGDISKVAWRKRRNTQEFTYGYAMTCHKAQGSQWGHVIVYDESDISEHPERWLYTAVTRASERLTLVM